MTSKRDLLVVRLAIKWKWLTPEEGEDVLFLKRKFGSKLTVAEIIRRRGYLELDELDQLGEAADATLGRRARPGERRDAPTDPREAPRPASRIGREEDSTSPRPEHAAPPPDDDDDDEFRDEGKTVIAAMPELLKKALARARQKGKGEGEGTIMDGPTEFLPKIVPQPDDFDDDEPRPERTIYDVRPAFLDVVVEPVQAKEQVTEEAEAYREIQQRPVLDPIHLLEQVDSSMPGEPVQNVMLGRGLPAAQSKANLTVVRDEAGVEFLEGDFGPYSIKRVIARGRNSIVYLAQHRENQQEVALKVLELPPVQAARFFQERGDELLAAARLSSPQVVRTVDVGRVGGKCYVALQYVDSWTLEEMLDAGDRPSYVRVAEIGRGIAAALAAAEQLGIMHLDVRPDHVMIAESGEAMLTGFGFAPERPGPDPRGPKVRGTPEYSAPEQALGKPDKRSDLYGLGATLYRVLTGKVPVEAIDLAQLASSTIDSPPLDPRETDASIPEPLVALVMKLCAKRPEARFQSALEAYEAFDQLVFEMEAAGFPEAPPAELPQVRPLLIRAAIGSLFLVGIALLVPIALSATELWSGPEAARRGAFLGMVGLAAASILLSTVALIRRGQIPLTLSSAWLVRLQESCAGIGTLALVAGFVLAPPAVLNVMVGSIAIVVLTSGVFGTLLRRAVANARADRGVGRMLAVLGDPILGRWRAVHVPLIACLTLLATVRFAVMAYFASA